MKHGYICSIIRRIVLFSLLTLLLSAGASNAETLILPGDVDIIEAQAFMGDASIGIAVLPEGITEIRSEAFADSSITEINLPASLTYIAPDAFSGTGLQKVSAVKGSYAYDWACAHGYIKPETDAALFTYSAPRNDCVLITGFADPENAPAEIIIPEFSPDGYLITAIDEEAFEGCAGLTAVTIPANIEVIYDSAFRNCVSLENLVLTEGLRTIASTVNGTNGAFVGCTALESVAIPSTVAEIGNTTFYGCSALTTVVFRDSSEVRMTIGREAFSGTALSGALSVPAKVSAIGEAAFEGTPISALTIAEGEYLKAVGEAAFRNCEFLTAVTIPGNVETIGANAFTDCIALNDLSLAEGLKTFASTVNYTNGAFVGCTSLESVTIPSTVAEIGNTTFYGCSALTTVVFRDSSEVRMTIGREAFSGTALSGALSVPAKVSAIGEAAFEGTPISALTIAEGEYLKAVGEAAFSSCAYLTAVTIPGNVETIGANAFTGCIALNDLTLVEGLRTIASTVNGTNGAFVGCTALESVAIPSTVAEIGNTTFYGCSALTTVVFRDSSEVRMTIGREAFSGTALSGALSVPAKVSAIGEAAFEGTPISALTIAEGEYLKAVGEAAFSSCAYLTAVTIPGNVETIGANAFRECIALESLELSEGLITIADTVNYDNGAFSGCSSLPSVTIPSTVTYIGRYAFHNCSALESVTINNSPENVTIGKNAFTGCPGTPVYAN